MKKIYDDKINLCSNRSDRQIPLHPVKGHIFTDSVGFTFFELDKTKRDFEHDHISLSEGCFFLTDDGKVYKIVSFSFEDKRPRRTICKTVLTTIDEVPYKIKVNPSSGKLEAKRRKSSKKMAIIA